MVSLIITRFMKTLMLTTPFCIMILMVLALWGVGGKATYTDLKSTKQQMELSAGEAKNYLVNETQSHKPVPTEVEIPKITVEKEESPPPRKEALPVKQVWGLMV